MKIFRTLLLLITTVFTISNASAQANATLNILTLNSGQVTVGQTVDIQVTVGNTGPTSSIGVNKVRPQISVPSAIVSILASQTGLPPGWTILSNNGSVIQLCNGSDVIPVGAQRQILIKIQGNSVGGPSTITGNLSFGPGTAVCTGFGTLPGDLTADNSSNTTIQVVAATACNLGVTASAGTILCNGGTTTLTATASGANGTVEYSITGGAPFQAGNTFTVPSGTYTVTARETSNSTCTATATPVIITEPAAVPEPAVSVTQPTCTVASGTITITSATAGLTFSLDGAAYAAYPAGGYTVAVGTHTLSAQNSNGCISAVASITIDAQPETPVAPTANVTHPTCTTATGTITITSATSGLTFSLDGGVYAPYPAGGYTVTAGSHTLTAQNSNGCISPVTSATINAQPGAPAAPTIAATQPTCTVASGTITITSATAGLTFSLDGGAHAAYPAGGYTVAAGSHTLTAQNSNGCISAVTSVTIDAQPETPAAPAVTATQPTCTVATGTITITSATAGLTFSLDGAAYAAYPAGGYTSIAAGSHTITAQNSSGCISAGASVTINTQPETPAAPTIGTITQPTCAISTGSVVLNNLPAGNWTINPGAITGNSSSTTINDLAPGTYNFTVTNSAGCTSPASADVIINGVQEAPPQPVVSVIQPTCTVATGTIIITSTTSGLTFSLDGGAYAAYPAGGYSVAAGNHTLTAQNASNCLSGITHITVNAQPETPAAPIVTITHPTCTIATGTIIITSATSGLTFSLDGGAYAAYPAGGYTVAAGSHTLTAQNSNGCISAITNATINTQPETPAAPIAGNITQPTCAVTTGTVELTGLPSGNWTLIRNPGGVTTTGNTSTTSISGLAPGTYNFTVTNSAGCTSPASADVVINIVSGTPEAPVVSVTQPTCTVASGTITITSATAGLTFSLDGGVYAAYPAGGYTVVAGAHTLTAQNAGSCISAVTNITINTQPETSEAPVVSVTQPTCTIATGTITVTSATAGLTFSLDGAAYAAYPAGGYTAAAGTHILSAQNSNGCISAVTSVIINTQPETPVAPIVTITHPTCTIATGTIIITSTTSGLTFSLDGAAYAAYPAGGFTVAAGSHTLTAQNTNSCISAVTTITVNAQPETPAAPIVAITHPTCTIATGTIIITSATSGLTFSLDGGTYAAYPAGGYTAAAGSHTLTAQNSNGCISAVTTITINTQPETPVLSVAANNITCFGGTATITATTSGGALPFEYSLNGGAFQSANTFTVGAGAYTVTVRNASLCTATSTAITITQPTAITATVSTGTIGCNGGTITLFVAATGGTGALQYSLNGGAFQSANTFVVGAGTYTVRVKDANNCSVTTAAVVVSQPATLVSSATAKRITACGGTTVVTVTASGGRAPYSGTGSFTKGPGTWDFIITDAGGCTDTATITIEPPGCMNVIVYPNPAKNSIEVHHSTAGPGAIMQVFGINGALLLSKPVLLNAFHTTLDITKLVAGPYLLVYLNDNEKKTSRFVKQ